VPVKGPSSDIVGLPSCVAVLALEELSTKGVSPCNVKSLVFVIAVRADVGTVNALVWTAVP